MLLVISFIIKISVLGANSEYEVIPQLPGMPLDRHPGLVLEASLLHLILGFYIINCD